MADQTQQIANLQRLLAITRQMAATTDLTQLLQTIIEATVEVLACERATIFLYEKKTDELYSLVATGAESIRFPADQGIAGAAARERRVVHVPDAYADPRFNREIDKKTGFRTRQLLTFPLENLEGELMGVLQALNKRSGAFALEDEEMARILSAQAGVALHRYALLEEYAEKQRMARDLELARKIQTQLLPDRSPSIEGYEIAGWNRSADETGGDCYDFIELADKRHGILLADATGHGIGAALVIAQCRSLTRAMLSLTEDLSRVALHVNRVLSHDLMDDRFVTAFVGLLDAQRHRLDYFSAGQGPLLFVSGDRVERRTASGIPLAVVDDLECDSEHYEFEPGATAILLTDGFFETANVTGDLFGDERVIEIVRSNAQMPLDTLIQTLHDAVQRYSDGAKQADDLTAVLIRRKRA